MSIERDGWHPMKWGSPVGTNRYALYCMCAYGAKRVRAKDYDMLWLNVMSSEIADVRDIMLKHFPDIPYIIQG
jgi:hypothetical protein